MSYEQTVERVERAQIDVFYDQLKQLAKAGAPFETTKAYLRSQGLEIEPAMTRRKTERKPLWGMDDIVEQTVLELEPDPNTVIARGGLLFGTVPVDLIVSYDLTPLESMGDSARKYRGLFDAVPHVAVSGFVGKALYQENWVVSDEVERAVAQRKSRGLERVCRGETSMRV